MGPRTSQRSFQRNQGATLCPSHSTHLHANCAFTALSQGEVQSSISTKEDSSSAAWGVFLKNIILHRRSFGKNSFHLCHVALKWGELNLNQLPIFSFAFFLNLVFIFQKRKEEGEEGKEEKMEKRNKEEK